MSKDYRKKVFFFRGRFKISLLESDNKKEPNETRGKITSFDVIAVGKTLSSCACYQVESSIRGHERIVIEDVLDTGGVQRLEIVCTRRRAGKRELDFS